jgi:hypothetical protein
MKLFKMEKMSCVIGFSRNELSLGSKFSQKIVVSELEKDQVVLLMETPEKAS